MIWLHISSPHRGRGPSSPWTRPPWPSTLALRSERAGLVWSAENRTDEPAQRLVAQLTARACCVETRRPRSSGICWIRSSGSNAIHSRFQLN